MMKKIKRFFLYACVCMVALILFMIIFPLVKPFETLEPRAAAKDGSFANLDNGLVLHYHDTGKGEPVLLIHGFLSMGYTWKETMPALSAAGYRAVAPDLPGYGFSSKPSDLTYNYTTFSESLVKLLDALKIKRVSLIGNSMGGGVSIRFTLDHPDRVNKLILVDSAGMGHKRSVAFKLLTVPGLNTFISSMNNRAFTMATMKSMMFHDKKQVTPERADAYLLALRTKGSLRAAVKTLNENNFAFPPEDYGNIKTPTLIIWGEKDHVIYPAISTVFHSRIAGSQLAVIPKCGHLPQEENPEAFNKLVLDFLKK